ncbi:MAG: AAA family ATPase [Chloroflexota bacterium]
MQSYSPADSPATGRAPQDPPLKAFFIAGGYAAGKTYVTETMFKEFNYETTGPTKLMEIVLKDNGIALASDLHSEEEKTKVSALRSAIKEYVEDYILVHLINLKSVALEMAYWDYNNTLMLKTIYESLGYEVYMIYVEAGEETCLARNQKRARREGADRVSNSNHSIKNWADLFKKSFGEKYHTIDNEKDVAGDEIYREEFEARLRELGKSIFTEPNLNPAREALLAEMKEKNASKLSEVYPKLINLMFKI